MQSIGRYWKAIIAFITPGVIAYQQAIQAGSPAHETVNQQEWTAIVVAMVLTGGGVAIATNKQKAVTAEEPVDAGLLDQTLPTHDPGNIAGVLG